MGFSWIHCIFLILVLLKNLLMLKEIIAVFIGGGIGSSLRYLISKFSFITTTVFPTQLSLQILLDVLFLV